jgi:hypothetical protein
MNEPIIGIIIIFGRTISQELSSSYSITYSEHYIPATSQTNNHLTPRRQFLILTPCSICSLNSYYPHDLRFACIITTRTNNLTIFKTFPRTSQEHKHFSPLSNILSPPNYYIVSNTSVTNYT